MERKYNTLARELIEHVLHMRIRSIIIGSSSFVLTRAWFANNEIYMAFLLNSRAQGVSGKNDQPIQKPWRGVHRGARPNADASA